MSNPYVTLKERGFIRQVTDEGSVLSLFDRGQATCYVGFDPTADSLHVGSLVPIMALLHIQRSGHRPIAVVGAGTAMVGDPSGKTELRRMLSERDIARNADRIRTQLGRYLDLGGKALALDNAAWLGDLKYIEFLRDIGRHFSVNRMLAAEAYRARMETGLSFLEFNYQLLQAYDFLVLYRRYGCAFQMGGDDQWGNILAGTDLLRRVEGVDAHAATFPLLTTASGQKMGKTAAGAVWLDPDRLSPYEFYQYWINTEDADVGRFLGLYTLLPMAEVNRLAALRGADIRSAKEALAFEATVISHGQDEAHEARRKSRAAFGNAPDPGDLPALEVPRAMVLETLTATALFAHVLTVLRHQKVSNSEARRLIQQGGAYINDRRVDDPNATVAGDLLCSGNPVVKAGRNNSPYRVVLS